MSNSSLSRRATRQLPLTRRDQVYAGLRDSLGVGLGFLPIGIALGILTIQAGLPWWLAPALSIGVFAGSVELLMIGLLATSTPLLTVAVTVLAVNFRHVFYPLSFPVSVIRSRICRAYSVYAMIDEAYATYTTLPRAENSSIRMLTGQALMQCYWVGGSLAGVALATTLSAPIEGFEFALCALFIVMALDSARTRTEIPALVLAGLSVVVAVIAVPKFALPAALVIYALALVARAALALRRQDPEHD